MKIARIDRLGRIVIPISYRRSLGITPEKDLNIEMSQGKVIISRSELLCKLCGKSIKSAEIPLCKSCISKIKSIED